MFFSALVICAWNKLLHKHQKFLVSMMNYVDVIERNDLLRFFRRNDIAYMYIVHV